MELRYTVIDPTKNITLLVTTPVPRDVQPRVAAELLQRFLSPVFSLLGIPVECALLVLVRPISGSAALAVGTSLMQTYGVDSQIGRTAAVMLGSTETTFYTISVYFGAAGIRRTRYTLPAALFADLVGFTAAAWTAKLFL